MKIDEIETHSEQIREILEKQPNLFLKWGITVIFIAICFIFLATWFIKYPDVIRSQVTVTSNIPPQKVYAKTTGRISNLFVKDKDLVESGEPFAIIDNSANYKDVFYLKKIIDRIKIKDKFEFPMDSLPNLSLGDIASQFAIFENAYNKYKLNLELKPFSNEEKANLYSALELNKRLENLKSQKEINKIELTFKKKDLNRYKLLFEKGVISEQDYEKRQLEYSQAELNYKSFEASISQIREGIFNAKKKSKDTEINRIETEITLFKNVLQSLNQLKKAIKDWYYNYVLKSNIKGKVSFLNIWNTNQNVNQGDLIFIIIPIKSSSIIAKLKTPPINSGKIMGGQKVNIKLDNYPNIEFGILKGTVKNISSTPDNNGLYTVDVNLSNKLITSYNKEIEFKQEMTGTAEIITDDLRLIERLFYQIKRIFEN
ncbi:HlyD family efflux transporter periplasmic adaptor subunit [Gaetbulibacter sp. M240]|uniref:HlyD family secretion protein n=1 Tax=Gaetbulibacter sp. M240 TaxID=3126511 RepID=UPI00374F8C03